MNRRIRNHNHTHHTTTATYLRYLRPGALAQLRDSKLKTRSHKPQIYRITPSSTPVTVQEGGGEGELPFGLTARVYAPRFPQRKKMMAIRAVIESVVAVVDGFSSDFVAAH